MTSAQYFRSARRTLIALILLIPAAGLAMFQSTPNDPVARLQKKIDAGEVKLKFEEKGGYLSSLLKSLNIPVSSQGFVFSKTSLQIDRIAPWSPRAIYFNDDVYVGFVQDGPILELAAMDPDTGAVFYTLDQEEKDKPQFRVETTTCLMCHDSSASTGGVPGLIVRSVYPDRYGYVIPTSDKGVTSDRTPLQDRWGGWYVTGTSGDQLHMGNMIAPVPAQDIGNYRNFLAKIDLSSNANILNVKDRFNTQAYLSTESDIVALSLLTHQSHLHNLITKTNMLARRATPETIDHIVEPLVRALLFSREARLTAPIKGTTSFAADFQKMGPRDSKGRSLRDLDLKDRLFKYPLSYLIYSDSFNALPPLAREVTLRRIREVLAAGDDSPYFAHLTEDDREAVLEIFEETVPGAARFTK
jgi:hypothetical protein